MGQKTHPVGFRLGIVKTWNSKWFEALRYRQWLHEDLCEMGETRPWRVVARKASASPATGSSKKHALEQAELLERAFAR